MSDKNIKIQSMTKTVGISIDPCRDLPSYADEGSSGADLRAHIGGVLEIHPGEKKLIPTGIKLSIPLGYEVQIRPRSGLAVNNGITVLNTPGTIDSSYRGEIKVVLINHGQETFFVRPEMRIAQMVLAPVCIMNFERITNLDNTERGEGGFGSSGLM